MTNPLLDKILRIFYYYAQLPEKDVVEIESMKSQLESQLGKADILEWKSVRYDALKDRYLNWNEKHFDELCGLYFDDEPIKDKNMNLEEDIEISHEKEIKTLKEELEIRTHERDGFIAMKNDFGKQIEKYQKIIEIINGYEKTKIYELLMMNPKLKKLIWELQK